MIKHQTEESLQSRFLLPRLLESSNEKDCNHLIKIIYFADLENKENESKLASE